MATVYDVHQHLWPPRLLDALRARREPPRLCGDVLELPSGTWPVDLDVHDPEQRLARLDEDGVDVALLSCPQTMELDEALAEAYHAGIADVVAASGGRFLAFSYGTVLDGFAGVCVGADELLDLERLEPVCSELERRGGLLFVHPGAARAVGRPDWWPAVVGYTAQMQAAYAAWLADGAARWPSLRVLFAILAGGAPIQLERLAARGGLDTRAVLHENVFLDTASYAERSLELALATYGVNQIAYGSDVPVISGAATLRAVRSFGQAVVEAVCSDTPSRLLA